MLYIADQPLFVNKAHKYTRGSQRALYPGLSCNICNMQEVTKYAKYAKTKNGGVRHMAGSRPLVHHHYHLCNMQYVQKHRLRTVQTEDRVIVREIMLHLEILLLHISQN